MIPLYLLSPGVADSRRDGHQCAYSSLGSLPSHTESGLGAWLGLTSGTTAKATMNQGEKLRTQLRPRKALGNQGFVLLELRSLHKKQSELVGWMIRKTWSSHHCPLRQQTVGCHTCACVHPRLSSHQSTCPLTAEAGVLQPRSGVNYQTRKTVQLIHKQFLKILLEALIHLS